MATAEELREALDDYVERANKSERVGRTLGAWTCTMHLAADDADAAFTLVIESGALTGLSAGLRGTPDLIVRGASENLADIFWGDANPASTYMQGAIKVQGSAEDVMKLDAMAMFVYLET